MGGVKIAKPVVKSKNLQAKLENLRSWQTFQNYVSDLEDENEVLEYMALEEEYFNRTYTRLRLYGRYNALRTRRERMEIVNGSKGKKA